MTRKQFSPWREGGPGRPPLPADQARTVRLVARVTKAEAESIARQADECGFDSVAHLIRSRLGLESW